MKTNIIILTGIPGVGKTTVLQAAQKACPYITVVNYGDEMLQIAGGQKIERDDMRRLPVQEQQAIEILAAQKIIGKAKGITIIDTHALIKNPLGFIPGIPQSILHVLHPAAIVAIESSPQKILERRHKDASRNRDADSIEKIDYHQQMSRSFITACSAMTGAVLITIQNDAEPSKAVQKLVDAIKFFHE
jgi:adenylate kinase